ncbi:amino acid transporter AVT1D-like isoform X2 [Euphorbia lathyris]|uniref:amino acid transporter AVT1D-like isoform X2 n=1 Tax=Euphorbia lathyris TaxID=212925 RepID=UPI003313A7D6
MKGDEDFGRDRWDELQTDDEENQAERTCEHDSETDSDNSISSPHRTYSNEDNHTTWPQSYRNSIDLLSVTPPSIPFTIVAGLTSMCKRRRSSENSNSLSKSLLSQESLDKEEVPTSTLPLKLSTTSSRFRISSFLQPPPQDSESSITQAVLNGINVLCGIGLLTTPYAIKEGGWLSLFILLLFGILSCYTGILLQKCLESSDELRTYPDIGQAAFGTGGRLTISILLYLELYAACVEYIIMMSDNLTSLFPNTFMSLGGINLDAHQIFAIMVTTIVLPTVWLRDLSLLSYLSVGGVGASILVAICLLWVGVVDKVGFHQYGIPINFSGLPFAIGIYGYSYSGHAVFPNIYCSMKHPSNFATVMIISFTFCWLIYTGVAVCGFLMFGDAIKSQYTLNMPTELRASEIALWTSVVSPMTKYALTITPVALSLEELVPSCRLGSYSLLFIIRTVLVISTLIVALTFPFFGFVMAFAGSSLAMLVAIIFPCACYLSIHRERLSKLQIGACTFTISVGVMTACVGTYSSVAKMADKFV